MTFGRPDPHYDRLRPGRITAKREEPTVTYATVRDGDDEWHIECRFSDGQKYAAIRVDLPFEYLADEICAWLNEKAGAA